MKALEIKDLRKTFGKVVAVDGISLEIPQGQFFGFLGPNGAGKTTVIHCVTGVMKFNTGSITLFGTDVVQQYRDARRHVGVAPQEFNVDFFGKVWKVLDYVGGYFGMRKAERKERIARLLKDFGLEEHADKDFRMLSGGLKRRVILARAMVHDPEFLILDEPTAGVDVELRHWLWERLRELNAQGKTILLTSHYLEEVEELCERVAIINKGKIVALGDKSEFVNDGRNLEDSYLAITHGEAW